MAHTENIRNVAALVIATGTALGLKWEYTVNVPAMDRENAKILDNVCRVDIRSIKKTDIQRQITELLNQGVAKTTPEMEVLRDKLTARDECDQQEKVLIWDTSSGSIQHRAFAAYVGPIVGALSLAYLTRRLWYRKGGWIESTYGPAPKRPT